MKKKVSMLLVFGMLITMLTTTAFAANADLSGHTYTAYQIFSGTQATDSANLGDIVWGSGVNGEDLLAALKEDNVLGSIFANCASAKDVAEAMSTWADSSDNAKAFAKLAYENKKGDGVPCENEITTLAAGYYLVVDTTELSGNNTVYNLALLQLTQKDTFVIANKTSVPEVVKKVKDTNDTTGKTTDWQDSADYDIGDNVPFQLKATLADNVEDYETYKVVFHDTLSAGLDYNNDAVVKFGETDVTSSFTITEEEGFLTITCDNVKEFGATNNSVITVEYTAKLDTDAVLGSEGNPNIVYLEYSNNPNESGEGNNYTGKTPEDKVIVFTYKVVINKVDENEEALTGATFELYKKNEAGEYIIIGEALAGEEASVFKWTGLDDGDYKLVETLAPAGYNMLEPIEFTISAEHDVDSADPKLTKLEGGTLLTGEVSTGVLTGDVINLPGSELPETGGIGTTIFYALGAVMVIGAGVLLVAKKRMSVED